MRVSARNAAYRRISERIVYCGRLPNPYEIPANRCIPFPPASVTGLIAMQKVVGSNPISRFSGMPCTWGGSPPTGESGTKSNHPRISPLFQVLIRISAWNGPDARRLPPIPPCIDPAAVLGQLAGAGIDELLADYPYLEREDVLAALEYAAAAAQERELAVVAPAA